MTFSIFSGAKARTCPCGSNLLRRGLYDAAHIFCCYICDKCEAEKRKTYRQDIFEDPNYPSTEPKEEEK